MELIFTANCGVIINDGKHTIAIDALHCKKAEPFSPVPQSTLDWVFKNTKIDLLLYTHPHCDHYDKELNDRYIREHGSAIIMPENDSADLKLEREHGKLDIKELGLSIEYRKLMHSGEQYRNEINYGYYISFGGKTLLTLGDSAISAPELPGFLYGKTADIAFINFPFYTLSSGRTAVKELIKPKSVIVQHLPFGEDDRFSYRDAIKRRSEMPGMPTVRALLTETLQRVEL